MTFYLFGNAGLESDVSQFGAKLGFEYEKLTDKNIIMNNKGIINDSIEHDGEIYICGGLGTADDSTQYLAKLSDTTKNLITDNKKGLICSMIEFNNELYVCGQEGTFDGTQYLAKFSDFSTNLIKDTDTTKGLLTNMTKYNNELYICGYNMVPVNDGVTFDTKQYQYIIKLSDLTKNLITVDKEGMIENMLEFNKELYICGKSGGNTDDGTQYLAKLSDFSTNLMTSNYKGEISNMIEFNNELYVCGNVITITTTYKVRYLSKLSDLKTNMFLHDLSDGDHEKDSWRYTGDINSMLVVKEDSNNLALILGLSIGLGIPILVVIIFMYQKYMPRTKNK